MSEHPVNQVISAIEITAEDFYRVGSSGVTRIEATTKSGMHADIPYVRVWRGESAIAEFCQHNIICVYFSEGAA
jgi:hypothetical protein